MADAGATVFRTAGENVVLHGLYPGDDGTAAYRWQQTEGPNATLSDPNVREPNFIAPNVDVDSVLTFGLTVTTPTGGTSTDSVSIGVSPAPQADAGSDQTVGPNLPVTLQGVNKGQGMVTFSWRQTNGPTIQMSDPNSAEVTFTSPVVAEATTLTFELAVKNPADRTSTDSVNVRVIPTQADAGLDQTVAPNQPVVLHGSAAGVGDLTVSWRQTAGPTVSLTNAGAREPNFVAPQVDANTVLTFDMTVTDSRNKTDTATTNVTVVPVHADAGRDYTTEPNLWAFLDGSASGVSPLTVNWRQVKGPNEPNVNIPDANGPATDFYLDSIANGTTLNFELDVTDKAGNVAKSAVKVNVKSGIHVRFKTTMGDFVMAMYSEQARLSVSNFLRYVNHGPADPNHSFYVGLTIHRVIPVDADPNQYGGMGIVQGGGWDPNLSSPPRYDPIPLESQNGLSNVRGTVAMARLSQPDTATSEFYVNLDDNLDLNYNNPPGNQGYAVFAHIIEGMGVIDAMSHVQTTSRPAPWNPSLIFYDIPAVPIVIEQVLIE
jgi:cyclophilin family peptidyl-prolyl cis-trans isomerase